MIAAQFFGLSGRVVFDFGYVTMSERPCLATERLTVLRVRLGASQMSWEAGRRT